MTEIVRLHVHLQHYFDLVSGARKAVHFKAFRAFTRKSQEDLTNTAITESTAGRDVIWLFYFCHFTSASLATLTNVFSNSTPFLLLPFYR